MIRTDSIDFALRFNWETPFFISPHNPPVFYAGGNRVMKSVDHGDNLYPISPDLSYNDSMKMRVEHPHDGRHHHSMRPAPRPTRTIVSLAESYVRPGLLYAGHR